MLDLETLGTRYNAAIIQIGACYFDRMTGETGKEFIVNVRPSKNDDRYTMDYDTIRWWMEQSAEARESVMYLPTSLKGGLQLLTEFIRPDSILWSHATFDMPILVNAFETESIACPIPFRNMRDLRTLMDLAALDKMKRERFGIHHNALDDAKFQASYASDAFVKLHAES